MFLLSLKTQSAVALAFWAFSQSDHVFMGLPFSC
jgi:hypothetical protein